MYLSFICKYKAASKHCKWLQVMALKISERTAHYRHHITTWQVCSCQQWFPWLLQVWQWVRIKNNFTLHIFIRGFICFICRDYFNLFIDMLTEMFPNSEWLNYLELNFSSKSLGLQQQCLIVRSQDPIIIWNSPS